MDLTIGALRDLFRNEFPDMLVRITKMFLGPSDSSKFEVQVKGPDQDVLFENGERIMNILRSVLGTIDIRTNWENRIVKVIVDVDQQRARRAGITSADISASISGGFDGFSVTEFRDKDDVIPIIFRGNDEERFNMDRVRTLNVFSTARQTSVRLFQIADLRPYNQFAQIERENMFRTVTIEAKSTTMTVEDLKVLIAPLIEEVNQSLPLAHHIEYDGVITDSAEAQAALSANMPIVIMIIIVLLIGQFNGYRKPLIIMMTIPLMMIGVSVELLLTNSFFGFMVILELYSLAGIIINNAIVLIDRIEIEESLGIEGYQAIINACKLRLRPIIMTTITTVLGLTPLIISRDPLFYGMANAMALGLAVGTVLTLGVVPVLYSMFYKVQRNDLNSHNLEPSRENVN